MPPSLLQTLLGSLLDSPAVVEIAEKVGGKALSILKAHFTFSAYEINQAYSDGYGYTVVAISVGLAAPDKKLALTQKIFNSKITREFAAQIEQHYLQPFAQQHGLKSDELQAFRKQAVKSLKAFAKHKDKLFQFEQLTDEDLVALISYRETFALTDLVLEQMQCLEKVDDTLAAFLRFEGLLGESVVFFFRELVRQDERLEKTQAALQREGLCIEVRTLQTALKTVEENLSQAISEKSANLVEVAQQLQDLRKTEAAWQTRHEQLLRFSRRFDTRLEEMLAWAKDVYSTLEEIHEDVIETKEEVKLTKSLAEEILQLVTKLMAHQGLSSQVKPRDEFTQHNSESMQLIRKAASQLKELPQQNPDYSRVSIMVGSALSSTGDLEAAERLFSQAIENAHNQADKALAYFNLFQVQLRRQAYTEALDNLQAAIAIEPQRYALHDIRKYPLERLLGAGGMGCVFLCQNHNRLIRQERVVVKCLWESLKGTLDEVFKEPFIMRDIAGDYIPEPLDFGYVDSFKQERAYFVTEYIDGAVDGEVWLEKYGPMDLETGLAVGLQIAKGLQIAHEAGIFHLDLKPANILLKKTTEVSKTSEDSISVKIIDFGLSKVATSLRNEAAVSRSRSGLSTFGQAVFGTLDYAPPEQQGFSQYGKPSATSDVFAFGATMYRLWTSLSPRRFSERKLPEVQALRELLFDCVEEVPKQRPSSARQLSRDLKAIKDNAEKRPQAELAQRRAEEERKRQEDEKAWQKAGQQNIKAAYQTYSEGGTLKQYAVEAKKRLPAIKEPEELASLSQAERKEDEKAWQKACQQNIKAAYQAYLNGNTLKKYAEEAQKRLQVLASYRYIDNGDGTVTDNKTGLILLKNANCFGRQNWETALPKAANLAHGQCGLCDGSKAGDWRLPTKDEWEEMVDKKYKKPALSNAAGTDQWKESDAFPGVQSGCYWAATAYADGTSFAWYVDIYDGGVYVADKVNTYYIWPVRGGQ